MESLKQLLAFPLYASAIWLLWVAGRQTSVDTMAAALLGALLLALGLWLWASAPWRRALALGCVVLALGLGLWRAPADEAASTTPAAGRVAWSMQQIDALRGSGQPVFVDVTADWCITCIANERTVLHSAEINAAFQRHGVTYMVADWTNYDAAIAEFLRLHGRSGIPLYVLYPGDPGAEPIILPQLLTRGTVLRALAALPGPSAEIAGRIGADSGI
ncbi:thioredoxin family protein [Kineobactrum salinum]